MSDAIRIESEIERLKQLLEQIALKHQYNFGHPEVLALSQTLDRVILQQMMQKKVK
ncbi:aspartyl-phosphate phosphatase Spo0E family protein [Paenibacillus doosanensis]|uniref:Spo0E like sporulation regulatory protein n=1 Tax=Paenibacillus konkukensis TaxID=2020716 RepID=A0ABY4RZE2_9BACL|nr:MULTISPECIES: aspartyl-phosphate phosphatase Spo0E family protein [Paenibacillus]MCS7459367.1 aspartyl-phosphate phosphatase Spo0E family protein [Paenibacillus doosanensis]UQZ87160.1 Spo0E like sporulation regulatory protein [Paenibacillus konkukensis]